jgi:hypothetical protein
MDLRLKNLDAYPIGQVRPVHLNELGDQFRRYRLRVPQPVQAMAQSLRRWGQCAPIVACAAGILPSRPMRRVLTPLLSTRERK